MDSGDMNNLVPAEVFPPGEFIRDELEAQGWTQQDLADITGVPASALNLIINGRRSITPETAQCLGSAFGTSADFWLNLETAYQLSQARTADDAVAKRARFYSLAPVGEMIRRGWIESTNNVSVLEAQLKKFFGCEDLSAIPPLEMAARRSTTYEEDTPSQRAWGYRVVRLGRTVQAATFDAAKLAAELPKLRAMTLFPENLRQLPALLASWGIRLVLVTHLERTKFDGATLWLDPDTKTQPVVGLSLRFDRIDWFWFTLLHELIHVKYRESSIDSDLVADAKGAGGENAVSDIERRANMEAAALLVPQDKLDSFILRTKPLYSRDKILRFAQLHRVHPGIVVGQLHHRKEIPPRNLRDLLVQNGIRSIIAGQAITDGWGHLPGAF